MADQRDSEFGFSMASPPPGAAPAGAPPTQPSNAPGARPATKWPLVIGVIAIVLGALQVLNAAMSPLGLLITEQMEQIAPGAAAQAEVMRHWTAWIILTAVVGLILGSFQVVWAIMMVRRRSACRRLAFAWAWLALLSAIVQAAMMYPMQLEMFEAMESGGQFRSPMPPGFGPLMAVLTAVMTLVMGAALPVFVLIWLRRRRIREEVQAWAG
ncbi:MAG TPA: hypothetical protein PKC49_03610 [Phycisphaerae bacterium]|nr:hypothetical protein [Phycisphaerae bacterium]